MKSGFRLAVVLALICALVVGVSACGGSDDSDSGGSGSTTADPSGVSGTVTVWDIITGFSPTYAAAAKKLDAAFEKKYPNVTIDHIDQPFETYTQIYKAAFAGREGPDVMNFPGGASGVLSYTDGLEPLNDWVSPDLEEHITGWEAVTPGFTKDGEHFGVPIAQNAFIFYYNKDFFEKAGLPREFEPKSWDEIKEAGEKLQAAGIQPFVGGDKEGYENSDWMALAWQTMNTEEQSVEVGTGEIPYTDEVVGRSFGPLMMIQEAGLYSEDRFSTPKYPDGAAALGEEKGAISTGQWATAAYYGEYVPKLGAENVGMFQPPGSKYIGIEPNWVWSIPKFADDKDAAAAYVDFLGSREGIQQLVDLNPGELPNRDDVELPKGLAPQAYELVDTLRENSSFPHILMFLPVNVWETVWTEMNQVLQGRSSLEDAQQGMQVAAERAGG